MSSFLSLYFMVYFAVGLPVIAEEELKKHGLLSLHCSCFEKQPSGLCQPPTGMPFLLCEEMYGFRNYVTFSLAHKLYLGCKEL